jgi:hypothetical protein
VPKRSERVAVSLFYWSLRRLLELVVLRFRSEREKEIEILLLREGFQNAVSCCSLVVFVDESAESVAALDLAGVRWTGSVGRCGREQGECSVWALAVVVRRVCAEHVFEVAACGVHLFGSACKPAACEGTT